MTADRAPLVERLSQELERSRNSIAESLWDGISGRVVTIGGYYELDDEYGLIDSALKDAQDLAIRELLDAMETPSEGMLEAAMKTTITPYRAEAVFLWRAMLAALRKEAGL